MQNNIHTIRARAIAERKRRDRKRARARFWADEDNQVGALLLAFSAGGFTTWLALAFIY